MVNYSFRFFFSIFFFPNSEWIEWVFSGSLRWWEEKLRLVHIPPWDQPDCILLIVASSASISFVFGFLCDWFRKLVCLHGCSWLITAAGESVLLLKHPPCASSTLGAVVPLRISGSKTGHYCKRGLTAYVFVVLWFCFFCFFARKESTVNIDSQ